MKVIKPNCRVQFAAQDVEFILSVLGGKLEGTDGLVKLLADEDSRDLILDDEALFRELLERGVNARAGERFRRKACERVEHPTFEGVGPVGEARGQQRQQGVERGADVAHRRQAGGVGAPEVAHVGRELEHLHPRRHRRDL